MRVRWCAGAALFAAVLASGRTADANAASDALRAQASAHSYNLEHAEAMATFKQAVAADPVDAAAYRGLATTYWLSITFTRGNMTVDDYLGRATKPNPTLPPPPPETVAAFRGAIDKAIAIARQRI